LAGLLAGVIHDSSSEFAAAFIHNADDIAALEVTAHVKDAGSEQACFALYQGSPGAFVYDKGGFDRSGESDPSPLAREHFFWQEQSPQIFAGDYSVDCRRKPAVCDDRGAA